MVVWITLPGRLNRSTKQLVEDEGHEDCTAEVRYVGYSGPAAGAGPDARSLNLLPSVFPEIRGGLCDCSLGLVPPLAAAESSVFTKSWGPACGVGAGHGEGRTAPVGQA